MRRDVHLRETRLEVRLNMREMKFRSKLDLVDR